MFNLREIFTRGTTDKSEATEQEEFERIQVATCVLLLEVAKSDQEFSSLENATIRALLGQQFQLREEAVEELIGVARQRRGETIDLWEFTHFINENYSQEEKIKIIETVWRVVFADDKLDKYENHLVHKLAGLLRLRHRELIDAKLRVLDELKS